MININRQSLPFFVTLILFTVGLSHCNSKGEKSPTTEYTEAQRQISKGNYQWAIATMSSRLNHDSHDREARLILSSAYAARAGVFMTQYMDVGQYVITKVKESDAYWDSHNENLFKALENNAKTDADREFITTFAAIYKAIYNINQLLGLLNRLPRLNEKQYEDLETAIAILSEEKNYQGGPALYRGLLRLTLLKNDLGTKYSLNEIRNCRMNVRKIASSLQGLKDDISDMLIDFALAHQGKKRESLTEAAKKVDKSIDAAIHLARSYSYSTNLQTQEILRSLGRKCEK